VTGHLWVHHPKFVFFPRALFKTKKPSQCLDGFPDGFVEIEDPPIPSSLKLAILGIPYLGQIHITPWVHVLDSFLT